MKLRVQLNDLKHQRADLLRASEAAYTANDRAGGDKALADAQALNPQIENLQARIDEEDRFSAPTPSAGMEGLDDATQTRVEALQGGGPVQFSAREVADSLGMRLVGTRRVSNATTLASGDIVSPTGTGNTVRGGDNPISSIVDQVMATDLTGLSMYSEPFVKTELEAQGGKISTTAGQARTDSTATFGVAQIKPYELTVTSYLDRNLADLTPVAYEAKIRQMVMRALRRKLATLIYNGDGQATPDFFGIKTAKDKEGNVIYRTTAVTAFDEDVLMAMYFGYGGDEETGGNARLYLNKADLKTIGEFKGTNERKRLFKITPDAGNANTGMISDGGYIIPYTLGSALTQLTGVARGASAVQTMLYGDPFNFELGLFGPYSIRVDESYKAAERLITLMGDVKAGGNLIVQDGFCVATVPIQA